MNTTYDCVQQLTQILIVATQIREHGLSTIADPVKLIECLKHNTEVAKQQIRLNKTIYKESEKLIKIIEGLMNDTDQ